MNSSIEKHPHVIFEARTKTNKGCANSGNLEWRMKNYRRQKHVGVADEQTPNQRYRRDVREATKYIETAIVIDKAMFEKRNGSTRAEVVHDAIQVANIADLVRNHWGHLQITHLHWLTKCVRVRVPDTVLFVSQYFRTLNTRVSVVYIETWQGSNQAPIDKSQDISRALLNFNDYTSRKLFKVDKDTTQLLTPAATISCFSSTVDPSHLMCYVSLCRGETFQGGESGMAVPETVCTAKSVGISVDINTYEPHLLAGTMAHMIGHNIGMGHDDGREYSLRPLDTL
uniref:Peptidase M12B domain-containing protein n=1 Tax=Timema douglasi TaxID=61478 RepID=A0A7R8VVG1_TIMDO|nr:unnamed protein product [Timema douglasi]